MVILKTQADIVEKSQRGLNSNHHSRPEAMELNERVAPSSLRSRGIGGLEEGRASEDMDRNNRASSDMSDRSPSRDSVRDGQSLLR